MGGTLHYVGQKPAIGTEVLITVDSVNTPHGIWIGELTELGNDYSPVGEYPPTCACAARIIDPKIKATKHADRFERFPTTNYNVYEPLAAMHLLLQYREEDKAETRGLNKRLEIERGVFHGVLKAMVSDKGFDKLEALLESFLERFEEGVDYFQMLTR